MNHLPSHRHVLQSCWVFTEWPPAPSWAPGPPPCWADWAWSDCPWQTGWRRTSVQCDSPELWTASQSTAGCLLKLERREDRTQKSGDSFCLFCFLFNTVLTLFAVTCSWQCESRETHLERWCWCSWGAAVRCAGHRRSVADGCSLLSENSDNRPAHKTVSIEPCALSGYKVRKQGWVCWGNTWNMYRKIVTVM